MIIDCHTHALEYWPYEPRAPDHESRGRVEPLLCGSCTSITVPSVCAGPRTTRRCCCI